MHRRSRQIQQREPRGRVLDVVHMLKSQWNIGARSRPSVGSLLNACVKNRSSVSWKRNWRDVDVQRLVVECRLWQLGFTSNQGSVFSYTVLAYYVPVGVADSSDFRRDISCLKGQHTWMKSNSSFGIEKRNGKKKLFSGDKL